MWMSGLIIAILRSRNTFSRDGRLSIFFPVSTAVDDGRPAPPYPAPIFDTPPPSPPRPNLGSSFWPPGFLVPSSGLPPGAFPASVAQHTLRMVDRLIAEQGRYLEGGRSTARRALVSRIMAQDWDDGEEGGYRGETDSRLSHFHVSLRNVLSYQSTTFQHLAGTPAPYHRETELVS